MTASKTYPVPENILQSTHLTASQYDEMYKQSVEQPEAFWAEHASMLEWYQKPTKIKNTMFGENDVSIKWFEDGELNASYNCIDRHLANNATKVAFHWEGDSPEDSQDITYQQVHYEVCKLANALKEMGVAKGDRVAIYMPMVPEAAYAMLACARIGAVHSVIFGGFSPNAPTTIPISINIYSKNLSLLFLFFVNLLTSVQLGHINHASSVTFLEYLSIKKILLIFI